MDGPSRGFRSHVTFFLAIKASKGSLMRSAIFFALLAGATTLLNIGCGPVEKRPSYADLVVIYNAELAALDRLERKKADLIVDFEKQLAPKVDDALQALSDVLSTAAAANRDGTAFDATDPNDMLDQAIENAAKMQQATSQLLEVAAGQASGETAEQATAESLYSEELKAQLAALDEEIAEQQARVDRARLARNAAEAK